jgi:hypothetical protein
VAEQEFDDDLLSPGSTVPPPPPTRPPTPSGTASSTANRREREFLAYKAGVIGAVNVLTRMLAVRAILLVSIGGAIALTWLCVENPDPYRLAALMIYSASTVVPMIVMSLRARPQ